MSDEPKTKRRTRIWWVAILVPVLYVPSYVPAVYLTHWTISLGVISQARGNELIRTAYAPVVWAAHKSRTVEDTLQIGLNALRPLHPTRWAKR